MNHSSADLRAVVDSYTGLQKVRVACGNRLEAIQNGSDELDPTRIRVLQTVYNILEQAEEAIRREMMTLVEDHPVYQLFLQHVRGISATLSARVLAFPWDPLRHTSSWWAAAGLVPGVWIETCKNGHKRMYTKPVGSCVVTSKIGASVKACGAPMEKIEFEQGSRRRRGVAAFWVDWLRVTMYLIARQFELQGAWYRIFYLRCKARELKRVETQGHARMRALRMTAKMFLSHLHEAFCDAYGIPYKFPYPFEHLDHQLADRVSYKEVVEHDKAFKPRDFDWTALMASLGIPLAVRSKSRSR